MEGEIECNGRILNLTMVPPERIVAGFLKPRLEEMFTYTLFAFVVVVGLFANASFIYVVAKVEKMHTVMNAYLVNLAVADIMILGYGYVDRLYFYLSTSLNVGTNFLGPMYCVVSATFEVTYYVSLFTVTLFSMERYTAVCHPMEHIKISTSGRTRMLLLGTWVFAVVIAVLQIPGKGRRDLLCLVFSRDSEFHHLSGDVPICGEIVKGYFKHVGVPLQLLPFYIALFGNAFFYIMMVGTLIKRGGSIVGSEDNDKVSAAMIKSRNAATRMIVINGCVFFFCQAPIQIFITVTWIFKLVNRNILMPFAQRRNIFLVLTILLYLNSAVNPFIYSVTNRQYRIAFFQAFKIKRKHRLGKYTSPRSRKTAMSSL
ncbi:Allatostatin-A receptor [Holothuria leucospilota]|uniref:Allatostatin-A receptor n=1 Tax=Holothuria leucospilota TaxID=206669 RepID=A0A9Q1H0X5_HOLLE|nr:Allatostatin-A receptor [Holothuria leucospilota]